MLPTCTKEVQDEAQLDEKDDLPGIRQEIKTWSYYQMFDAPTRISLREYFKQQTDHLNPARRPYKVWINNNKK